MELSKNYRPSSNLRFKICKSEITRYHRRDHGSSTVVNTTTTGYLSETMSDFQLCLL